MCHISLYLGDVLCLVGFVPCTVCRITDTGRDCFCRNTSRRRRPRYPEIKRPQEARGGKRQRVPGRNWNHRSDRHFARDNSLQSDSRTLRTLGPGLTLSPCSGGDFLLRPTITAYRKKRGHRETGGTLKSSVQPWKIETTA